jgi:two-component system sensor histidine kinase UhpB
VTIEVDGDQLRLAVRDPGQGAGPWASGVGLHAMRERVEAVGGRFTLERDESGTAVLTAIPLSSVG